MKLENLTPAIGQARAGNYKPLAQIAYEINKANGYWDKPRGSVECAVLACSELYEMLEAYRKHRYVGSTVSDNMAHFGSTTQYKAKYEMYVKDRVESELAGFFIRCMDWWAHNECKSVCWATETATGDIFEDIATADELIMGARYAGNWDAIGMKYALEMATAYNIDLLQFVALELRYNAVRGGMKKEGKIA